MLTTGPSPADAGLRLINEPTRMWRGTAADIRDVWQHRELLRALTARELRSRYKGSTLGWAWALVRPLVMLFVYGLAVGVFLGAGRSIPQFMIFIYSGLIAWGLFSTIVTAIIASIVSNGPLITRASFPRLLLPLSVGAAALVDFALQASVLLVAYAYVGDLPSPSALLWVPPALAVLILLAVGVGLVFAALNVYVRDIGFLVEVGLQVGFWMVPVIYSYGQVVRGLDAVGWNTDLGSRLYMLNPMSNVVLAFQRGFWPPASSKAAAAFAFPGRLELRLLICTAVALVVAWFGMRVFVRLSGNFGQEL